MWFLSFVFPFVHSPTIVHASTIFLNEQMGILIAPKPMLLIVNFLLDSSLIFSNACRHFQLTVQFFLKLNTTNSSPHSDFVFIGNTNSFLVSSVRNFRVLWFFWCWGFPLLYYVDSNSGSDFHRSIHGSMQQTFTWRERHSDLNFFFLHIHTAYLCKIIVAKVSFYS